MRGHTEHIIGFDGVKRKDLTFLKEVDNIVAARIHANLSRRRKRGERISNWWYYPDSERMVVEWGMPLFR
jgi:hypothetical protein